MDIEGEYRLNASRDVVWQMLNDTSVLKACIPGCESLEESGEQMFDAKITAAIGPVKAKFNTQIKLKDLVPPERYTIEGNAKSGAAGFGRGSANVFLDEIPEGTLLRYTASLKVGGKLAQVGSRMVAGATRKTADDFFGEFADRVGRSDPEPDAPEEDRGYLLPGKGSMMGWLIGAALAIALVAFFLV